MRILFACLLFAVLVSAFGISAQADISFDRESVNVLKGESRDVDVFCNSKKYKVYSSDKSIATVSKNGKVKGKKAGDCEIVVTCGREKASIPVHVMSSIRSDDMTFIGHRGYQDKYPENTISAFRGAFDYGAAGVEFDLWETRSDELFVFHDKSLQRMCGKNGTIRALTRKNRNSYKVRDNGKTDKIPTLEEAMSCISGAGKIAYIHLKTPSRMRGASGDRIADCIRRYNMIEKAVVFCSNKNVVRWFAKHHPDITLGYLYLGSSNDGARSEALMAHASGASYYFFYNPSMANYGNIRYAHRLGMKAGLYQTTTKKMILDLMDYGADFAMLYHKLIRK